MPFLSRDFESFRRIMDLTLSGNHGLEFCLGTWTEMGEDLFEVIEYFDEGDDWNRAYMVGYMKGMLRGIR